MVFISKTDYCWHLSLTRLYCWQGLKSAIIQDVPISQPLNRIDVQELQTSLDMAQELPRVGLSFCITIHWLLGRFQMTVAMYGF